MPKQRLPRTLVVQKLLFQWQNSKKSVTCGNNTMWLALMKGNSLVILYNLQKKRPMPKKSLLFLLYKALLTELNGRISLSWFHCVRRWPNCQPSANCVKSQGQVSLSAPQIKTQPEPLAVKICICPCAEFVMIERPDWTNRMHLRVILNSLTSLLRRRQPNFVKKKKKTTIGLKFLIIGK